MFWTGDRAREAAREPPLEKQIAECKEFIEGSQKRVAAETVSLEDARQRLARWQRVAVPTVPKEAAAGVANVDLLRAKLAEAEAENSRAGNDGQPRPPTLRPRGTAMPRFSSARRRAGVIRLEARQTHDLRDVLEFGTRNEILQMTSTVADGAAQLAEITTMAIT